ncbi:MAG: slipin family protein [Rhizobiales bacterium]|nr:slipin family protein [Hyphomicrobiales bacterium]
MKRFFAWVIVVVCDGERVLVTRDGRLDRLLKPGRHVVYDPSGGLEIERVSIVRAEFPIERARLIQSVRPDIAEELFEFVETTLGEVAIVYYDGQPVNFIWGVRTRAFLKGATRLDFERFDTDASIKLDAKTLAKVDGFTAPPVTVAEIGAHETGLVFVDGALFERIGPGRHGYWRLTRKVEVKTFDLRPQPLEVTAQEILTKDRIGVRVTLTAFTRIVDPLKATMGATDAQAAIYRLVQFAIREAIAGRTLDEILGARDRIDAEVRAFVSARTGELGVEMTELGVKDVILPGDVRELINKVVEAERTAKANLIRRQEETAATRSLLNTAKLMEDNPLLVRLKELEALEKLVEKVGRIDLHAGESGRLDALVKKLWTLRAPDQA